MSDILTADFKAEPYWWEDAAPVAASDGDLPQRADVLVIGSGYTGLHAALQTARGGRDTVVIDAEAAGWGCSTRNGGQISTSIKPSIEDLTARHGEAIAHAIHREGHDSIGFVERFVRDEKIDCDFRTAGRFYGAHSPRHYDWLAGKYAKKGPPGLEVEAHMVSRSDQHAEIGTDSYYGGAVIPAHANLHPAKYHSGLAERVLEAGARIVPYCRAEAIDRESGGFRVRTAKGTLDARNVVIATNGYTGPLTPWHRRRVIPIGSYVIATEKLAPAVIDRLMPTDRNIVDTRRVVFYYRTSPDRTRIVFGGRVSISETDPIQSAGRLRAHLVRLFPELETVRISHSWMGFVAYTFDELMHVGETDGLHFAGGYCGSGVGLASHLGMKLGKRVLGAPDGATAFADIPFPTRPFYTGNPWFLAPTVAVYNVLDRLGL